MNWRIEVSLGRARGPNLGTFSSIWMGVVSMVAANGWSEEEAWKLAVEESG
jgi:hypothetical protein